MATLTVNDQSMTGDTINTVTFEVSAEQLSVQELIRSRVFQEAKEANAKQASRPFSEPVVPLTASESALNGKSSGKPDSVDWHREFEKVLEAFRSKHILVFVNDRQMTSLEETVSIDTSTQVRFLRLTMLMGG